MVFGVVGSVGSWLVLGAGGLYGWASNVYSYNREAWMTDIQLKQQYEYQFDNMNIATHGMSREEVRDRTQATITKLSNYILVTTLILALAAEILVEGRIPVECADFILNVYMLCMGTSVLYLVLSILFGIVATNEIYEYSARLLTSKPPPWKEIDEQMNRKSRTLKSEAFENKPWYEILRPPLWRRMERVGQKAADVASKHRFSVLETPLNTARRHSTDTIADNGVVIEEGGKSSKCFDLRRKAWRTSAESEGSAERRSTIDEQPALLAEDPGEWRPFASSSHRPPISARVSAELDTTLHGRDEQVQNHRTLSLPKDEPRSDEILRQTSYAEWTSESPAHQIRGPRYQLEEIRRTYKDGWERHEEVWKPLETLSFQCMALGVKNLLDVYGYLCMAFLYSVYEGAWAFWAVMFVFTALNVIMMEFLFPHRCLAQTLLVGLVPVAFAVSATTPYLFVDRILVPMCYMIHCWLHWRVSSPSMSKDGVAARACSTFNNPEERRSLLAAISKVDDILRRLVEHETSKDPALEREFAQHLNDELAMKLDVLKEHSALVANALHEVSDPGKDEEDDALQFSQDDLERLSVSLKVALERNYPGAEDSNCPATWNCMLNNGTYTSLNPIAVLSCEGTEEVEEEDDLELQAHRITRGTISCNHIEEKRKAHEMVGPRMMRIARWTTLTLWTASVGWAFWRAFKAEGYKNDKAMHLWTEFNNGPPLADIEIKATRWPSPYFKPHSLVCPRENSVFMADQYRVFQRLKDDSVIIFPCDIDGTIADVSADCDKKWNCWPIVLLRHTTPKVLDCKTGKQYPLLQAHTEAEQFAVINGTTLLAAHQGRIVEYTWNHKRDGWSPTWVVADMGKYKLEALDVTNNKMLAFRQPGVVELQDLHTGMHCGRWVMPPAVVGAGCAHDDTVLLFVEEMSPTQGPVVRLVQAEMNGPHVCQFKADNGLALRDRFAFPNQQVNHQSLNEDQVGSAYEPPSRDDDMPRYGDNFRTRSIRTANLHG